MAFRRPRVNVKPNVQATRPVGNTVRSQDTTVELISTQSQEEQCAQQIEVTGTPPIIGNIVRSQDTTNESVSIQSQEEQSAQQIEVIGTPPIIKEPISSVEEITKPPSPALLPVAPPSTSVSLPVAPPSPPPASIPAARPLYRIKIAPNIGAKTTIHHRRPSASCSGTESESESSRQKHSLASTITFGRTPKSIISNETQSDLPINEDLPGPTKAEAMITEISEVHTSLIYNNYSQISSRINTKISREHLTQHINYRAQRLASKVEPEKTIRKRRAATLEKLDETGVNKGGPVDTSKLKIADFVHYNPIANPMEAKIKTTIDTSIDPVRKYSMSSTDEQNSLAPQLKIGADGIVVVDEQSIYFRPMEAPRNTVIVEGQFNDDNLTHQSYRKIGRRKRWNNRDTLRFYQALRMYGTDFTSMAQVFANRNRDDIKRKFKTEDKANRTLVDSALRQRVPFDLTCFFSPSDGSSVDENGGDVEHVKQKKLRKRRVIKRKSKQTPSSDPLEINRRREKRLQTKKNSMRIKKSAEFIDDDDDEDEDESSMDVADTVEVMTTAMESKSEQVIPSTQNEENSIDNSLPNMAELENLLGRIDGSHLVFVHNTDETTGLDRIDVHVVMPNGIDNSNEQSI